MQEFPRPSPLPFALLLRQVSSRLYILATSLFKIQNIIYGRTNSTPWLAMSNIRSERNTLDALRTDFEHIPEPSLRRRRVTWADLPFSLHFSSHLGGCCHCILGLPASSPPRHSSNFSVPTEAKRSERSGDSKCKNIVVVEHSITNYLIRTTARATTGSKLCPAPTTRRIEGETEKKWLGSCFVIPASFISSKTGEQRRRRQYSEERRQAVLNVLMYTNKLRRVFCRGNSGSYHIFIFIALRSFSLPRKMAWLISYTLYNITEISEWNIRFLNFRTTNLFVGLTWEHGQSEELGVEHALFGKV